MSKPTTIDFKGNITKAVTQLAIDFKDTVDWIDVAEETTLSSIDSEAATLLETETFTTETAFDALNRPTLITQPDGSLHKPGYNDAGMLSKMEVQLAHESSFTEYVEDIEYDAKGQRTDIFYGNGSKTRYDYDPKTFRLTRLLTTRNTGSDILQDLNYTYDPVGNIVEMVDDAQQTHYFSNTVIEPKGKYTYDALYRLLKATGRELSGLNAPTANGYTPDFVPTDGQSNQTLQTYCEQYTYDALGNILELSHRDTCGGTENWKRTYEYSTNKPNNYLQKAYTGSTPPSSPQFTYDAHGNLLEMPHLNAMTWDFEDQLKTTEKTDETTYYVYAGGERVRKVCYNTATDKIKHERIYLGGYEIYREYDASEDLELERTSNHVMDDRNRIAILEVKTLDNGTVIAPGNQVTIARYQYSNHLGSAALELNEAAEIISYQEYHPFGSTSYELHTNDSEVSLKRYQYVGKERDGESGLYYYGARYYAAWLCRFVSVDPLKDDYPYYTTYQYAGNKPITSIDVDGLEAENQVEEEEVGQQDTPANVNNKFIVLQSSKTGENYALPLHNLQEVDITADKPIATFGELAILSLHVYPDASDTVVLEGFKPVSEAELEKLGLTIDKGFVLSHKDSGFNSQLYSRTVEGKKQYVYAFQGTDFYENNKDMETNANQILTGKAHQYAIAVKNARMLKEKLNENLMFTGHSLGGGLASIAALFTGLSAVTFNAAAISEKTKDKYNLNNVSDDRIIAFHVKGEVVTEGQSLIDLKAEGFPITLDAKYIPIIPIGKVMILVTSSLQAKQKIKNHSMYQVIKRMKAEGYM